MTAGDKVGLENLLDRVATLVREEDLQPRPSEEEAPEDPTAAAIRLRLGDASLRPEHRARIYADLLAHRDLLLAQRDPRVVDLIHWGEHVAALYAALRRGRLSLFHYTRAFEATCRRCGFELLPLVGRVEELGKLWAARNYDETYRLLSADVVELDPAGEAPEELGS